MNLRRWFGLAAWILVLVLGNLYGVSYDAKYVVLALFVMFVFYRGEDG